MKQGKKLFIVLFLLATGAAAALLVRGLTLDSDNTGTTGATAKTATETTVKTETKTVEEQTTAPETITVTVANDEPTVTVEVTDIDEDYCKANPQTCAAIESEIVETLSKAQQQAIRASQKLCGARPADCVGPSGPQGQSPQKPSGGVPAPGNR